MSQFYSVNKDNKEKETVLLNILIQREERVEIQLKEKTRKDT